jgi:hypothetical protein
MMGDFVADTGTRRVQVDQHGNIVAPAMNPLFHVAGVTSSVGPGQWADAPRPSQGQVGDELDTLDQDIKALHTAIADLRVKLVPIMGPDAPLPTAMAKLAQPKPSPSPLAVRVADLAAGARDARAQVLELLARVQL